MICETVKIQRGDAVVTINKSDFVEGKDKLYEEKPAPKADTKAVPKKKAKASK